ncbi:MAG: hypothetical protein AAGA87_15910 [Pseudomonadota bacterium]
MNDRITLTELRTALGGTLDIRPDDCVIVSENGVDIAVLAGIGLLDRLRAPETKDGRERPVGLGAIIADAEDLYARIDAER